MKKIIFLLTLALFFLSQAVAVSEAAEDGVAQTPEGPTFYQIGEVYTPRLLPDSPWFFLKSLRDDLQLWFTFDPVAKVKKQLTLANKRVLELQRVCELGKCDRASNWPEKYEAKMRAVYLGWENLKAEVTAEGALEEELEDNLVRQQIVLDRVYQLLPEGSREGMLRAKENARSGWEKVLEKISGPEAVEQGRARFQEKLRRHKGGGVELEFEVQGGSGEENDCPTCQL